VHVTSQKEQHDVLARFPSLHVRMVPNGVDIPAHLDRTESDGELRLLFLGRLHPIKGIESLLDACSLLSKEGGPRWRLTIAGWGTPAYVAELRARTVTLGLDQRVQLVGGVVGEAKKKLLENSDVVIVPSHSESFGIVVAEALAHGLPVIASTGTPWSGLEEKRCGLWVENDPTTLASAICEIGTMPVAAMGLRGREWMQKEFSWTSVTTSMVDLYHEIARGAAK
jgi:glycosyltransferase involved in cell wall biosynthesis